ncbi:MAG TPA: 6-hydroxymethylpterin diphosphokinase MptE-like protein [Spirochaetia bacterium]|nr:6-hydroxymethylpterin diphosphokinase MptE-like protein [Spirochaetia bacterium]
MEYDLPRLLPGDGGIQVKYRGKNLYSTIDPVASAERKARSVTIPPETIVIVPSPLLGYGLQVLVDRLPATSRIVCVEVDESLMAITLAQVPEELLQNQSVSFVRLDSPEALSLFLNPVLQSGRYRRVTLAPLSGGYSLYSAAYRSLIAVVERDIRTNWQNRLTGTFMGRLWMRNIFRNLAELTHAVDLSELHVDLPVVVAGAGESLEFTIPWLLRSRNEFHLLAVDTAVAPLVSAGIVPDYVVVLEAQWANLRDFVPVAGQPLRLAGDISSHPAPFRLYRDGTHALFLSEFIHIRLIDRLRTAGIVRTVVPPLGSVGVVAVHLARLLGGGNIFLTGLDFAYRRGKTHAKGTPSHLAALQTAGRLGPDSLYTVTVATSGIVVADSDRTATGHALLTNPVLRSYAESLRNMLKGDRRVRVLGNHGLDVGVQRLKSEAEFISQLRSSAVASARSPANEHPKHADVMKFLSAELALLVGTTDAVTEFLNSGSVSAWKTLEPMLLELDYVYCDFPDGFDGPKSDKSFLKRVLVNLYGYRKTVERALSAH